MAVTNKQRVKINAALSMIHSQGYDPQHVVAWAADYQRKGFDQRRAYEQAINEFVAGQPALAAPLGKITRLVEASDANTVAQYGAALDTYIATGDGSAIDALGPMIATDSVALAVKNGELPSGAINAASVEAALGMPMADNVVHVAAQPAPAAPSAPKSEFGFKPGESHSVAARAERQPSQGSTFGSGGRVADKANWNTAFDGNRMNANASVNTGPSRTLVQGHRIAAAESGSRLMPTPSSASQGPSRTLAQGHVLAPATDGPTI